MSDKLVEEVARAIYESQFADQWVGDCGIEANLFRQSARAAIEATNVECLQSLVEEATAILRGLEPYLDAVICYASTMDEHEPNRLAANVRAFLAKVRS